MANGQMINDDNGTETSKLEFDPFGGSIGFDGYLYGSGTTTTDNNDLIKGFQKFQGAAGQTYTMDGIAITQEHFLEVFNSARFGGMLGLAELSARLSGQIRVFDKQSGKTIGIYDDDSKIPPGGQTGIGQGELGKEFLHTNWAINWALIPTGQQDDSFQKAVERMTPCERYIRDLFFDKNVVFHDTWEQKGVQFNPIDPFYNKIWTVERWGTPDDHAYPDWTDDKNYNANVYLPQGGKFEGSYLIKPADPIHSKKTPYLGKDYGVSINGFVNIYIPKMGITVSIYHIANVTTTTGKGEKLSNGRTKIGTFGDGTGGELLYDPPLKDFPSKKDWVHIHINLYKGPQTRRGENKLPLSTLCPKNLR
jgi:hypothetical protein